MKRYVKKGEKVKNVLMPWSEVCISMNVCGKKLDIKLLNQKYPMVQLYKDDQEFSASILPSEAGLYQDSKGYYLEA